VFAIITFLGSYLLSLPEPELSVYGIANVAVQSFSLLLASYAISRISNNERSILPIFIVLLVIWSWFYVGWLVVGKGAQLTFWQFYGDARYQYLLFNVWMAVVFVNTTSKINGDIRKPLTILVIYLSIVAIPLQQLTLGAFWHLSYDYNSENNKYKSINEEDTYYKQFELIESAKLDLLPERKGIADIYFVGFGGYANQDVFMKEVQYARELFDKRYDTEGRSIALINNIKTMDKTLLASKSNLDLLIKHIGSIMNPEEDILFLYLTSHGSKSHELSVNLMPLSLNKLRPIDLKNTLDSSRIRYRVLLVSSCYSGEFIEHLKDEYSVIVTASAPGKKSFGCSNASDFTYFGKAIFEEQLQHNYNFVDAFDKAIKSIGKREHAEKRVPSEPQIFVGEKIIEKLESLYQDIKVFNQQGSPLLGGSGNDT
jgi:hypothetical protein